MDLIWVVIYLTNWDMVHKCAKHDFKMILMILVIFYLFY